MRQGKCRRSLNYTHKKKLVIKVCYTKDCHFPIPSSILTGSVSFNKKWTVMCNVRMVD